MDNGPTPTVALGEDEAESIEARFGIKAVWLPKKIVITSLH